MFNNTIPREPSARFTNLAILSCMFNNVIISNVGIEGSGRCNPHVSSEKGSETDRGVFYMFNYIIQENPQFVSRPLRSSL